MNILWDKRLLEIKPFNVVKKILDNFLNCLMRKPILHFECSKTMLTANNFVE